MKPTAKADPKPRTLDASAARNFVARRTVVWVARVLVLLVGLCAWQLVCVSGGVSPDVLPRPRPTLQHLPTLLSKSETWQAVWQTLDGWALGMAVSLPLAVGVGLVVGSSSWSYRATSVLIHFFRAVPIIALLPLAVLTLGATVHMKAFLVLLATFWVILLQTIHGVWDVDPVMDSMTRSFRLGWLARARWLLVPSIGAHVATGFRLAAVLGILVSMGTELLASVPGIGFKILQAQTVADTVTEVDYIIIAVALALTMSVLLTLVERRILHWHPAYRERASA